MQKTFEYLKVQTAMDSFSVDDIGNVILQATNDEGLEWYLRISTDTGYTTVKEFGPLLLQSPDVPKNGFHYACSRSEYSERGLCKTINLFLNNPHKEITQVIEISEEEFLEKINFIKGIL